MLPINIILLGIEIIESSYKQFIFFSEVNHTFALRYGEVINTLQQQLENEFRIFCYLETHHLLRWLI